MAQEVKEELTDEEKKRAADRKRRRLEAIASALSSVGPAGATEVSGVDVSQVAPKEEERDTALERVSARSQRRAEERGRLRRERRKASFLRRRKRKDEEEEVDKAENLNRRDIRGAVNRFER